MGRRERQGWAPEAPATHRFQPRAQFLDCHGGRRAAVPAGRAVGRGRGRPGWTAGARTPWNIPPPCVCEHTCTWLSSHLVPRCPGRGAARGWASPGARLPQPTPACGKGSLGPVILLNLTLSYFEQEIKGDYDQPCPGAALP